MGRKKVDDYSWVEHAGRDDIVVRRVVRGRKVLYHLCRTEVAKAVCHVDTLRFVLNEIAIADRAGEQCQSPDDFARIVSGLLADATGFGLGDQVKPRDFYDHTWGIGPNASCGHVACGGGRQKGTVLVSITGVGCMAFRPGWERRLHDIFLPLCPRITRGDAARDDYQGLVTVHDARQAWHSGEMDRYHNRPVIYLLGCWEGNDPYSKGLTVNIGTRESPMELCVYQKGKQLGDPESNWTRIEARFRDNHHVIPWDFLIRPQNYFVSGNAFLSQFAVADEELIQLERKAKYVDRTWDHLVFHARRCYGPLIKLGRQMFGDAAALDMLQAEHDRWPAKLDIGDHQYPPVALHERPVTSFHTADIAPFGDRKVTFVAEQAEKMPTRIKSALAGLRSAGLPDAWSDCDELELALQDHPSQVFGADDAYRHGLSVRREQAARDALGPLPSSLPKSFCGYEDGNSLSPVPRVLG